MKSKFFERCTCFIMAAVLLITGNSMSKITAQAADAGAVFDYVKAEYEYALSHTEQGQSVYRIDLKGNGYELELSDAAGSDWVKVSDYLYGDLYYDYLDNGTKKYRNPFRYYVDKWQYSLESIDSKDVKYIEIVFDVKENLKKEAVDENLSKMQSRLDMIMSDTLKASKLSDDQKVLMVHEAMSRELDADYENFMADDGEITTDWGTLIGGKGISSGYAFLFNYCMNRLGITSEVVQNDVSLNYWNKVQINGEWYQVDTFFDDLYSNEGNFKDVYGYTSHSNFLRTDLEDTSAGGIAGAHEAIDGNMVYMSSSWYFADSADRKIYKINYNGTGKSAVTTEFPAFFVATDGSKLYYASDDRIIRIESGKTKTGIMMDEDEKITGFSIKNGDTLVYTVEAAGKETDYEIAIADIDWNKMVCKHEYERVVTEPTCTEGGYTTATCKKCKATKIEKETKKLGHKYVKDIIPADTENNTTGHVTEKCSRCGEIRSEEDVPYAKTVNISIDTYIYNGSKKKPIVEVLDSEDHLISRAYYTVVYSNNLNVGQGFVTVEMRGKYTGKFVKTFMIMPKTTTLTSVSGLTRGLKINWKKQTTQVAGYEVQYSTSSNFSEDSTKSFTITKNYNTKKLTGLSSKKKYYVRIRTYSIVRIQGEQTKLYSKWSATKNAKAK